MSDFLPIQSSHLIGAKYDVANQTVDVQFKNGVYRYEDIKPDIWKGFEATFQTDDSSGKYFRSHIQKAKFKKL